MSWPLPPKGYKIYFLGAVSAVVLSGCGWLSEDVSSGSYNRWESTQTTAPSSPINTASAVSVPPKTDESAELQQARARIAALENEIQNLRNDMKMMMPALSKLSLLPQTVEGAAARLQDIQPAAGAATGGEVGIIHRNYLQGDEFGDELGEAYAEAPPPPPPPVPAAPAIPAPATSAPAPSAPGGMVPGAPVAVHTAPQASPPPAAVAPVPPSARQNVTARLDAPAPVAVATPISYTPPAIHVNAISNVRFGNHEGGKSRIVIDVASASAFTYDIDNKEKILVIEVPGTVWNAGPLTRQIADNPLIKTLSSQPDGEGGTTMVIELSGPAQVLWAQSLPQASGSGNRLVFDISSL